MSSRVQIKTEAIRCVPRSANFRTILYPLNEGRFEGIFATNIIKPPQADRLILNMRLGCTREKFEPDFASMKLFHDNGLKPKLKSAELEREINAARAIAKILGEEWNELFDKMNIVKAKGITPTNRIYWLLRSFELPRDRQVLNLRGVIELTEAEFRGEVEQILGAQIEQ